VKDATSISGRRNTKTFQGLASARPFSHTAALAHAAEKPDRIKSAQPLRTESFFSTSQHHTFDARTEGACYTADATHY
jgi:hypothetical protein